METSYAQRWPVNSPHKSQWRGALMFSLIGAWMSGWVNKCEAGKLRRLRTHYDVRVMKTFENIACSCTASLVLKCGWWSMSIVRIANLCHSGKLYRLNTVWFNLPLFFHTLIYITVLLLVVCIILIHEIQTIQTSVSLPFMLIWYLKFWGLELMWMKHL